MSKHANGHKKIQGRQGCQRCQGIPMDAKGLKRVQNDSKGPLRMEKICQECQGYQMIPKEAKGCKRVPKDAKGHQRILKDAKDVKEYQRMPKG